MTISRSTSTSRGSFISSAFGDSHSVDFPMKIPNQRISRSLTVILHHGTATTSILVTPPCLNIFNLGALTKFVFHGVWTP
jgi:hypothetical protein